MSSAQPSTESRQHRILRWRWQRLRWPALALELRWRWPPPALRCAGTVLRWPALALGCAGAELRWRWAALTLASTDQHSGGYGFLRLEATEYTVSRFPGKETQTTQHNTTQTQTFRSQILQLWFPSHRLVCAGAGLRWRWAALVRWAALGILRWTCAGAGAALALGCAGAGLRWR